MHNYPSACNTVCLLSLAGIATERLKLKIPWKNLYSAPIIAEIDGLYAVAGPVSGETEICLFIAFLITRGVGREVVLFSLHSTLQTLPEKCCSVFVYCPFQLFQIGVQCTC